MSHDDNARSKVGGHAPSVISLDSRRPTRRFSMVDDVLAYWDGLRGDRVVPLRSEVDPRGIGVALDCAFIVERIAPKIARFRLTGSHLVDLLGTEVKGMPLSVMFAHDSRGALAEAVEGVFAGPETARFGLVAERGFGRPSLEGEMILLPLKSDLGDVSRALGVLATTGRIGRAPRRLNLSTVQRTDTITGLVPTAGRRRAAAALRDALPDPASSAEARMRRATPAHVGKGPAVPGTPAEEPGGPTSAEAGTERLLRPVPGAPHLRVLECEG